MDQNHLIQPQPDLASEIAELRAQLNEAKETLEAIRTGAVDALVVSGPAGESVFSLEGVETPYRSLVEEINEGALMLKPDGTILYANARFAELAKTPLERIIGSPWTQFFPPADHRRLQDLLQKAGRGGQRGRFSLEAHVAAGRPVKLSLSLLKGTEAGTLSAIVTDLTERKQAEDALRHANEKLEARVQQRTADLTQANDSLRREMAERKRVEKDLCKAKAELERSNQELELRVQERTAKLQETVGELEYFSYTITHDMRAPLRAMSGYGELLLEESANLSKQSQQFIERINTAAHRMDQLILDALDYNKLVRHEYKLTAIDGEALLHDMLKSYPQYHPSKVHIVIKTIPTVLGNKALLTQCFSNLLNNAVKFVQPGKFPEVLIWAEESGDRVRIWFQDNGIGIPKDLRHKIFLMFQRINAHYEGTGIGLALVRKAAERMGGSVGVESEATEGSRFWLEFKKTQDTN